MENWVWGLSLIALTIAIHGTGIALMAFATVGIRVDWKGRTESSRVVCS